MSKPRLSFGNWLRLAATGSFPALVFLGLGILGFVTLSGGKDEPDQDKKRPTTTTVHDAGEVLPSALRVLDDKISVKDGFILVTDDPGLETFLLPLSSPWLVRCGVGASVQLGVTSSSSEGSEVVVWLSYSMIDKSTCAVIALKIGARLQEKLAER